MADKYEKDRNFEEEEQEENDNLEDEDDDEEDDSNDRDASDSRPNRRSSGPRQQRSGGGGGGGGGRRNYQQRNYRSNRRGFFSSRRKVCPIRIEEIDWKKVDSLRYFIGEHGGIRPRRKTGATAKLQRKAAIAIKRARHMALLPFTGEHLRLMRHQRD